MITAMLLAHLVGDYVLQWDSLAAWKSSKQVGVFAHTLVVLLVTWLFSLPFDLNWWPWVLVIWLLHWAIDAGNLALRRRLPLLCQGGWVLVRFTVDQVLHVSVILLVLVASGYLSLQQPWVDLREALLGSPWLTYLLGYTFVMMPAWVIVKLAVYTMVEGETPDFRAGTNKYIGILERLLITTFVVLGQYLLALLVTLPRFLLEQRQIGNRTHSNLYLAELLASVALAIIVGLGLRLL